MTVSKYRGFIVWEGPSPIDGAPIVMVATARSSNSKTGDMVQTWILRQDMHPVEAIKSGDDASICGDCTHRPANNGTCYVEAFKAPASVWRAYVKGVYPKATPEDLMGLLAGRKVRLGAYGDPGMVPLHIIVRLCSLADGWTGYTHQWRVLPKSWAHYVMASADNEADRAEARGRGWRNFFVIPQGSEAPSGAVLCMAERERPRQCIDCGACAGTREGAVTNAVDIFIEAHGAKGKKFAAK